MAVRLLGDDAVVSLDVVRPDCDLLVVHERGWGKRVPLEEFSAKGRYTQGNWATDHTRLDETGPIVAAHVLHPADQITVITANGIVLRTSVQGISRYGRTARGVRIVNLGDGDSVAAVAVLNHEDLQRGVDNGGGDVGPAEDDGAQSNGAAAVADGDGEEAAAAGEAAGAETPA
jgi:DNA gyrase subunit A